MLKNAIEASRDASAADAISVAVASSNGASVRIVIRDRGKGLPAPIEGAELMRGLASAKAGGERGLGLPIAHKIIHDHGGRLRLLPGPGQGAEAVIELPVAKAQVCS